MVAAQTVCCSFMCSCFALCVWNRCLSASTSHHYHSDTFIHICSDEFVDPRGVWLFGLLPGCIFHDLTVYVPLWNQNKHAGVKQPVCLWETGDTSSLIKQLQTATTLSDSRTHYSFPFLDCFFFRMNMHGIPVDIFKNTFWLMHRIYSDNETGTTLCPSVLHEKIWFTCSL